MEKSAIKTQITTSYSFYTEIPEKWSKFVLELFHLQKSVLHVFQECLSFDMRYMDKFE
jgi:hypothetical protein